MRRSNWLALGSTAVLFATVPAWAGDLAGTATPVLSPVQLSTAGQPTFAQYNVIITNTSVPTISGWRFVGRTTVLGGVGSATFSAAGSDARCSAPNSPTEIVCNLPPLTSGASQSFQIAFNAPTAGTEIDLSWRAFWDESGNGGNDGFHAATPTALEPPSDSSVSSVVPSLAPALTFFTGGGVATQADSWVTRVKVPANVTTSTIATIVEVLDQQDCARAPDLLTCATSALTIPGTFSPVLEITLLRDASTIAKGAKIDSARIFYKEPAHPDNRVTYPLEVPSCTDTTTYGPLPQSGIPCEDRTRRKAYAKKSTPKVFVPSGFEGDWEFVIYAVDNGKYAN